MSLKKKLVNREQFFAGWISFAHPSIAEIFANSNFDAIFIDIEHSTISLEQSQRIIAASQFYGVPCIPRPVSHNNDYIKPLLDSGADGILAPYVESDAQVIALNNLLKYPPVGARSYGINRAQEYGKSSKTYFDEWNERGIFMIQIESKLAVQNIDSILDSCKVDGVMIGPMDISGSYGIPGDINNSVVKDACTKVIDACLQRGISCGTQLATFDKNAIKDHFAFGYTYAILGSDLFALNDWMRSVDNLLNELQ